MRRILLGVSGLSPQVLTETVYALAVAPSPAERWQPDEVQVLTTAVGARLIRERLLQPRPGGQPPVWQALLDQHGLPPIRFDADSIHVIRGLDGQPLDDIRSRDDNACMADAITARVRALTRDPEVELHVSLAGGRKTMGYYAGYALSLFGRSQDRLSHVLVAEPFETLPDFFHPTATACLLRTRDGREVDAAQAQLSLAEIPFVRLREGLPKALLEGDAGFADTVAAAEAARHPPRLVFDLARQSIEADGQSIELPLKQFALLLALGQRAREGLPPLRAPGKECHDAEWAAEVLASLRRAWGRASLPEKVQTSLGIRADGMTISADLSKLRKRLAQALAPGRAERYLRSTVRPTTHCVPLEPGAIHLQRPA